MLIVVCVDGLIVGLLLCGLVLVCCWGLWVDVFGGVGCLVGCGWWDSSDFGWFGFSWLRGLI